MQERKKSKKIFKKVIIFFVIVSIPFILFKLFVTSDMPYDCQEIENGWKCSSKDNYDINRIKETKKMCEQKGNVFYCEGPCYPYMFCYIPFDDAGKECINSEQCKGYCEADYNMVIGKYGSTHNPGASIKCDINDRCKGNCSKMSKEDSSCSWFFEVNNGYYIFHGGIRC